MKKESRPVIFFGNERLATGVSTNTLVLRALINSGYPVVAVVSNYEPGQSRNTRSLEIAEVAEQHGIPLLLPNKLKDIKEQLISYRAAVAILVAYGKIIPKGIIELFPAGIVNVHPSLLPLHRGSTPIESVILESPPNTGVSIMQLAPEMDAGPIYGQAELRLTGDETKQGLADTLLDIGQSMLIELLPGILDGTIVALPQDSSRATYDNLISKEDGIIGWHKPAVQLEREIRAFIEWPKSRTTLGNQEVVITKAKVINQSGVPGNLIIDNKQLIVYCGEQALQLLEIKPANKSAMSAEAFLAGYKQRLV